MRKLTAAAVVGLIAGAAFAVAQAAPVKTVDWQWDIPGVGGAYKVVSTCHGSDRLYLAYNAATLTASPGVTVIKDGCVRP